MPRKTKTTAVTDKAAQPQFSAELLEQLIPGPVTPAELEGIFQQLKKSVLERALGAEMSHHLGYAPGQAKPEGAATNHRNGNSAKTVLTDVGALRIDVPRDREGSFEPQLIGKHERRLTGFDDKIIAMYARGMTVREIQGFVAELYSVDVSPDLISSVTDAVMSEVTMPADTAARHFARAIERGTSYTVIPWQMGVAAKLLRLLPDPLFDALFARAGRKPRGLDL